MRATVSASPGLATEDGDGADPETFFVPPYVGRNDWVGMRLDAATDWGEVEKLVKRSYRLVAPKRLTELVQ